MAVFSLETQATAIVSTALIMVLSAILAYFMTSKYFSARNKSMAFWSIGLWLFTVGVLEEILFASGVYSQLLIKSYLAIVAILVQFLAMGSLSLVPSKKIQNAYLVYSVAAFVFLVYSLGVTGIGNIISSSVVFGPLPLLVILSSSLITFPAAVILLITAAVTYRRTRSNKMLSIIAGVIIVSVAGTLYIAKFPAFLYLAEFIGILLLWLGFFDFKSRSQPKASEA